MSSKKISFKLVSKDEFTVVEMPLIKQDHDYPPEAMIWTPKEMVKWNSMTKEEKDAWYNTYYAWCYEDDKERRKK